MSSWTFLIESVRGLFVTWDEMLPDFNASMLQEPPVAFGECCAGVNRQEALTMAFLSHLAYVALREGEAAVLAGLADPSTPVTRYRHQAEFYPGEFREYMAFSVSSDEDLIFVFRGSASLSDWICNLCTDLVGTEQVHAGFDRAAERLWPWVMHVLTQREKTRSRRIFFTGHSLGGAVATLIARRVATMGDSFGSHQVLVYTFGCPSVGASPSNPSHSVLNYRALGDSLPSILLSFNGYAQHGLSFLCRERYSIRSTPDLALMAVLDWAQMVVDVADRYAIQTEAGVQRQGDLQVAKFFLQPFQQICHPTAEQFAIFATPLLMPLAINEFLADLEREDRLAATKREDLAFSSAILKGRVSHLFNQALADREAMLACGRAIGMWNRWSSAGLLLLMKRRHAITNYVRLLSQGRLFGKEALL